MSDIETKLLYMLLGGLIIAIINHYAILRRERSNEIQKNLILIANNMREMEHCYNRYYSKCIDLNFDEAKKERKIFFKLYNETYNLSYFYFEEFSKIFISNLKPVINNFEEIEKSYALRFKKDEFNIERNTLDECIYEDQYFINPGKFFKDLYESIKIKLNNPLKEIDFKSYNYEKVRRYNPTNTYED